ncbi:NrfD/PsrC family molybdoenzyme membrane anchor subunit [Thiothrix subterranea]|uniref:NrfD/PsrC family molybdoenzyme membrane anchor subunit n=1 Tax=Thiothrix subterranea TaxID=2735563 RepID=A0AA51R152_9GAMM|nr:NrfD/PsrC family molybdoenzyme membrane anchor subunit [Thiothrix subterranea]MDQ5769423.1 NrfD/PsrC family molybdoenzyme membrane anchor subunit [Thiothrix subterranea]WML86364.1 NrfD/PsrC family molybdoenzyme membrane anchor subunit [Thiothrix subterranea]
MASQAIIFRETKDGKGFYLLLAVLGAFLALGALAFFHAEHHGHHVTGMNNQVVWGLPHVFAIGLIVAASGALNVGSIGTVFGKKIYQPMGRLSALLAISLLVGGLIVLVLDLGHPDRLIIAMTTYNFKSIFAWNIILYNGFLALSAVYIWTMMDRKVKSFYKLAGVAAFTWRLILTTGTGSIFGFLVARDFYNSAVMAPLFIVMSFAMGLAVFILVLHFAYSWTGRPLGDVVMNRLRYLLATFIGGVLLLEGARHFTGLYIAQKAGVENFILFDGGIYTQLFWVGQIMLGSLLPLSLIFCRKLGNNRIALLLAALFTILGGFAQLYVILIGGQAYPLVLFPGAEVSSDYFDGAINAYAPSIWELMLGLGGVALALVMVTIGVKVLRFLPDSLSDAVADPHSK